MRFSLASILLLVLVTALSVGWWTDSTRTRNELLALKLQRQELESLQLESRAVALEVDVLAVELDKLKRLAVRDDRRWSQLVTTQCQKSSAQLRSLKLQDRIDLLLSVKTAIPNRIDLVLKREIRDCKHVLALAQRQLGDSPNLSQQIENQISDLKTNLNKVK